ncbi:unnamed protein product [Meloidogyne enterolobii]|uniref:Uncharacterized protein n=1 Tax=Meloidogyne enterolobii TaxID=390850 RepID=A0ACB0ZA29_MELEN
MLFWFDDGPGTRKASTTLRSATTILPTLFASTLFVLVLLGQVNCEYNGPIGFYDHTLKDGQVTLAAGSDVADEDNIKKYTERAGSCDVRINDDGNVVVYYKGKNAAKNENTKKNGCALDLLTKHSDYIEFSVGVKNKDEIASCLKLCGNELEHNGDNQKNIEYNLLVYSLHNLSFSILFRIPFAYSYSTTKENITKLKKGPVYGDGGEKCVDEHCTRQGIKRCMQWTSLAIAWNICFKFGGSSEIEAQTHVKPIGLVRSWSASQTVGTFKNLIVYIVYDGEFGIRLEGDDRNSRNYAENKDIFCLAEGIAQPRTWKVNGSNPSKDQSYNRLLTFYLLPLNSMQVNNLFEPKDPVCDQLYIQFNKTDYKLLVADPKTMPDEPKTQPTKPPVKPTVKSTQKTTTTEPPSNNMVWVYVVGGVLFVVALIVAVFICFVVNKKKADPLKSGKGGVSTVAKSKVDEKTKEKTKVDEKTKSKVDEKTKTKVDEKTKMKEKPKAGQRK